jgi:hypothetical protein
MGRTTAPDNSFKPTPLRDAADSGVRRYNSTAAVNSHQLSAGAEQMTPRERVSQKLL